MRVPVSQKVTLSSPATLHHVGSEEGCSTNSMFQNASLMPIRQKTATKRTATHLLELLARCHLQLRTGIPANCVDNDWKEKPSKSC